MKDYWLGFLIVLPQTIVDSIFFYIFSIILGLMLVTGLPFNFVIIIGFLSYWFASHFEYMIGSDKYKIEEESLKKLMKEK